MKTKLLRMLRYKANKKFTLERIPFSNTPYGIFKNGTYAFNSEIYGIYDNEEKAGITLCHLRRAWILDQIQRVK